MTSVRVVAPVPDTVVTVPPLRANARFLAVNSAIANAMDDSTPVVTIFNGRRYSATSMFPVLGVQVNSLPSFVTPIGTHAAGQASVKMPPATVPPAFSPTTVPVATAEVTFAFVRA